MHSKSHFRPALSGAEVVSARERLELVARVLSEAGGALEQVAGVTLIQGGKHFLRLAHDRFQQRSGTSTKLLYQRLDLPLMVTSIASRRRESRESKRVRMQSLRTRSLLKKAPIRSCVNSVRSCKQRSIMCHMKISLQM